MRAALLALALASPVMAEEVLTGPEFQDLSQGYTLHFELGGGLYGSEQYFEGRRSRWRAGTEGCQEGIWYEQNGAICFEYEGQPGAQCWIVTRNNGEIWVRTVEDEAGVNALRLFRRDQKPLDCPGPDLGV